MKANVILDMEEPSQKELNNLTKNFLDSVIFHNQGLPISDVLSIIESPFIDRKDNDILSQLFHKFYIATDIPVALPVFCFLGLLSALCVKNKTKYIIPYTQKSYELATWVMCLAPSGSSKTLAMDKIIDLIPDVDGEKLIENNFEEANGPAAFVQSLQDLPDGRGFWFQDEASQMFKAMETVGHPMADIRKTLLKIKDHKEITWKNKKETIKTDRIVITQLFINTIDSMAKAISDESMKDGIIRRYTIADCQNLDDKNRHFTDRALYDFEALDENLTNEFAQVLSQDIADTTYKFTVACKVLYEKMFKIFWSNQYEKFMTGSENIYRTYMMEAWKYAVFHHLIHKKEGYVVDENSMQWALKVVMFLLNSFQSFIKYRATKGMCDVSPAIEANKLEKFINFIKENENKKGFGIRAFCRKFTIKKEEAIRMLRSIQTHNPKLQTKLYLELPKTDRVFN